MRAEILRPEAPLGFVHPLVRDAVYHELSPAERELQHERAARTLRDHGAPDEQVAAQLLMAPPRGEPWVAELLEAAGAAAMRSAAVESAVAYLQRALEEPPRAGAPRRDPARARARRGAHERPGGGRAPARGLRRA